MAITRLSGGLSPADGSDPRTFPLIFDEVVDAVEAVEGDVASLDTDDVAEGTGNLYFTDGRADGRIAAANVGDLADVDTTGVSDNDGLTFDAATGKFVPNASTAPVQSVANKTGAVVLDAADITSGAFASARLSGSYTGITGTGTLNAGSITSGFGNINIGSSAFIGSGSHREELRRTSSGTFTLPTAARKPGVRVTIMGGGGGGGSAGGTTNGGNGGTTTFNPNGASAVTAGGGAGGRSGAGNTIFTGRTGDSGFRTNNGGHAGLANQNRGGGSDGGGGDIRVFYVNLSSSTTAAVTIGGGGSAGSGDLGPGGPGGIGQVILEF